MCKVLEVSTSSYYEWKNKEEGDSRDEIESEIHKIFTESNETYGKPRIHRELKVRGIQVSESTVGRRMRKAGLRSKHNRKKKFKVTTDSDHDHPVAPNLVERAFRPEQLNQVWVSDITYLKIREKWHYITMIMDLADRMILAWNLSTDLTAENTIIKTWEEAKGQLKREDKLIFHSDRGVQYASDEFSSEFTEDQTITQSMSRKGDCWDNAVAESFFKTLKIECTNHYNFRSTQHAFSVLFLVGTIRKGDIQRSII